MGVVLGQVTPEDSGGVEAGGFEDVGDVAPGDHDDRVVVLADLPVSLGVEVGGGDQDAELAVPKPGDKPARLPHPDTVGGCIALDFEGELDGYTWPMIRR